MDDIRRKLAPVEREVRKRLGNFILAEDDQTLEGVVLDELAGAPAARWRSSRRSPSGQIAARIAHLPGAEKVFRRGIVARDLAEVCAAVGLDGPPPRRRADAARRPRPWRARRGARPAPPTRWPC